MRRAQAATATALAVAAAFSWFAAGTKPFTTAADAATAVAFAVMAAVLVRAVGKRRRSAVGGSVASEHEVAAVGAHDGAPPPSKAGTGALGETDPRRFLPWMVAVAVLVGFELATFFAGNRAEFPTLSSLYDAVARLQFAKAIIFFCWLSLGFGLFAR